MNIRLYNKIKYYKIRINLAFGISDDGDFQEVFKYNVS